MKNFRFLFLSTAICLSFFSATAQQRFYFDIGFAKANLIQKDYAFNPNVNHRSVGLIDMAFGYTGIKGEKKGGYLWKIFFSAGAFDRKFDSALSESPTFSMSGYLGYALNLAPKNRIQLHAMGGFNWIKIAGQKPESFNATPAVNVIYYGTDPSSAALAAYYNQLSSQPQLVSIQGFPATKRFVPGIDLGARLKLVNKGSAAIDWYFDFTPVLYHGSWRGDWRTGLGFRF